MHRRIPVAWREQIIHRFNPSLMGTNQKEAWICAGCRRQIDLQGNYVKPENADFLTREDVKDLLGRDLWNGGIE